ncbi:MAG: potassium channel protein, partial [Ignavibacteriaceae bacterium]
MIDQTLNQLKKGAFILLVVLFIGSFGFMLIEHWDFLDSLYMTIITITTTGFEEVHPLTHTGRIFTIILLVMGIGSIAYTGGRAAQLLIENQIIRRRRMSKKLEGLKDHYIVCGYGRMGRYICEELASAKVKFIVIDNEPDKIESIVSMNYLYLKGDATSDEVLTTTGVMKARGLVAVLSNDAENVFTTLSAKALNPNLYVVARAVEEETESKLKKAGANRVVKPYEIGGNRMAELLLRPGVIEFIDVVARERSVDLSMEEFEVDEKSELIGKSLAELPIRKDLNIIIVSINKLKGGFIY